MKKALFYYMMILVLMILTNQSFAQIASKQQVEKYRDNWILLQDIRFESNYDPGLGEVGYQVVYNSDLQDAENKPLILCGQILPADLIGGEPGLVRAFPQGGCSPTGDMVPEETVMLPDFLSDGKTYRLGYNYCIEGTLVFNSRNPNVPYILEDAKIIED